MSKAITLRPRLSEKTYGQSENRVYVMDVPRDVNKLVVAHAVEAQFEVKVTKVNIANIPGKAKRVISLTGKRAKNTQGTRSDIRKAYVTLAEGHSLPFFEAIEAEEAKEEAAQAKIDKAVEKQAAKTAKKAPKVKSSETDEVKAEPAETKRPRRLFLRGRKGKGDA